MWKVKDLYITAALAVILPACAPALDEEITDEEVSEDATDQPSEAAADGTTGDDAADGALQSRQQSLTAEGITYYDGCRRVHQACRCQNTGWAGFCDAKLGDNFDIIIYCYCG